jgi:hypothetical protein
MIMHFGCSVSFGGTTVGLVLTEKRGYLFRRSARLCRLHEPLRVHAAAEGLTRTISYQRRVMTPDRYHPQQIYMPLIAVECVVVAGFQKHARCHAPLQLVQRAERFIQPEEDHSWRSARMVPDIAIDQCEGISSVGPVALSAGQGPAPASVGIHNGRSEANERCFLLTPHKPRPTWH